MSKKPNFLVMLESQIDKIVLGLMIIISLALLWLYVLSNPYAVKVGSKKLGPGQIDRYVKEQAEQILEGMDELAPPPPSYNPVHLAEFDKNLQCPIADIANLTVPYPGIGDVVIEEDRLYLIPEVGELTDVQVASLRGAAEVPTEEVAPDNPYKSVQTELGDIDQVTISANFDIRALMTNFQLSFMGPQLKSTWKDSSLANPIFARLELQRRVKDSSGWSDWAVVPRTKIDMYKNRLEQLPLTADEASFGVGIYISQYQDNAVQLDILQPEPYKFSVSQTDWMPPAYLQETYSLLEKEASQRRRDELDARKKQETDRNRRRPGQQQRPRPQQQQRGRQQRGGAMDPMMMLGMEVDNRPARTPTRKERTLQDVEKDAELVMIKEGTQLETLREEVLVWSHDDTTEPGKTYQYRLRIGVFNPIAGKNWFRSDQEQYKDQFVLWSNYSEPTEEVFIPKMLHVFPMDTVERADAVEGVQVEVAKYFLGKWRTHDFDVYPGETIGYEVKDVEQEDEKKRRDTGVMDLEMMLGDMGMESMREPETVDFSTGMTMVDISRQVNWGARLRRGFLYQLLYYDPAMQMQQVAISKNNWNDQLRDDYNLVQDELEQEVKTRPGGGGGRLDELMMMERM